MTENRRHISLEEMRIIQLDILDAVHEFCMARGLRYSLGGGTLLGAVRHKGYIPWDDDIDIMMPRPDYERFISEFAGYRSNMSLQNYDNDPQCYLIFSKVYDNRTVLEEGLMLRNGVAIDVFPIDGLPAETELDSYWAELSHTSHRIYRMTRRYKNTLWKDVKLWVKKLYHPSRAKNIRILKKQLAGYDFATADFAGAITGSYGKKEHMSASTFRTYVTLPFEGREYMAIADYDSYLTKHYGDYMQLPPEDKRCTHHTYEAWWK